MKYFFRTGRPFDGAQYKFKSCRYLLTAALMFFISPALLHAQAVTTSVQVPLAGTVFVPLSNGTDDMVMLSGMVHVFTYFQTRNPFYPGDPMRIHINLDQVSGVGDLTGLRYNATGTFRINLPALPSDPMNTSFDLRVVGVPPDPLIPPDPIVPLDISIDLSFNPDTGALMNVDILSMMVPVP